MVKNNKTEEKTLKYFKRCQFLKLKTPKSKNRFKLTKI